MSLQTVNPAKGELVREFPSIDIPEILRILDDVVTDAAVWRGMSFYERGNCFRSAAKLLRANKEAYGKTITLEMGKPITEAMAECEKCAWVCEYYADKAAEYLADEPLETSASEAFATFQPLGCVLAIMPWNFPFWQVFRAAAPGMMAGNAMVLKHASNVPQCALTIESIFQQSGFPMNVFRTLMVGSDGAAIAIAHPAVNAVTLTGSTKAGEKVAAMAGSLIKKCVLELGGADAYIVLEDADLDLAVEKIVAGRMLNAGQSCIAAKRAIVLPKVREAFEQKVVAAMKEITLGDPTLAQTKLGPMARIDLRDEIHDQVQASIKAGAKLLIGGYIPEQPGAWYPPTVISDSPEGSPAYDQEMFGPVLSIVEAKDEHDAVRIANSSEYGLGGAVFTQNLERGRKLAREKLHAGAVFINDFVKSDPRLPFGGMKRSGYGRELSSYGIKEFVNIKTVVLA
ncbi:NAD-dependent succinate-semialdehyde dehydrogenase [Cerasicoccus arenae]|uniref:Aldehyde dehydrogenase n=1 Tax=Cerasicoccus arenae TaxID=424488 RepID=A0A8J3DDY5_9BACT|nr:NAD-dependent succinate-semialdehyde dehydrogenase [Cerasicoccus arenae]MBK1857421.1 NAD-dependent succinate-semialdehyde dehydrogenase [Cerasicoccus arenae]GHC07820.1 aldehyde dehydrogenase [Cerasicoccus arenae]